MGVVTNLELFEELYKMIQSGATITEVLEEWGGSSIYIPSMKSTFRNELILRDYKGGMQLRELAKKYSLSLSQIYHLTKDERDEQSIK